MSPRRLSENKQYWILNSIIDTKTGPQTVRNTDFYFLKSKYLAETESRSKTLPQFGGRLTNDSYILTWYLAADSLGPVVRALSRQMTFLGPNPILEITAKEKPDAGYASPKCGLPNDRVSCASESAFYPVIYSLQTPLKHVLHPSDCLVRRSGAERRLKLLKGRVFFTFSVYMQTWSLSSFGSNLQLWFFLLIF